MPGMVMEATYRKNVDLATWHYLVSTMPTGIDLREDRQRARWLAEISSTTIAALAGFARINHVNVSTDSKGEDSFSADSPDADRLADLDSFLLSTSDVYSINFWLDLQVFERKIDGFQQEIILYDQAWLFIYNNFSKYGETGPRHGLIDISFGIETDIYSPVTYCDNRTLAELNGPRLAGFLHRLEEKVGLTFLDVDPNARGGAYDLACRYGFTLSDDPVAPNTVAHS